jgi:uncharacterized protein
VTRDWERAIRAGDVGALERLVAGGADVNARDRYGQTGLMVAAHLGRADVVRFLANHRATLDRTAKFGLSALMLAVVAGHADVVHVLVDAGADLEIRGTGAPGFSGKTALDLAVACGRADVLHVIRAAAETRRRSGALEQRDTPPDAVSGDSAR